MTLEIQQENNLGIIRFNRPEVYNSFNQALALSLIDTLTKFHEDASIRAIMITGNGKAFCAGQDLQEVTEDNGVEIDQIVEKHYNPVVKLIRTVEKPVLAAVNGVAAGAGANIALACDVVVAAKSATFIQSFSKIGLVPDSGGSFTLPRLIGFQKASALMMLAEKVSADEAERLGMVYKVIEDKDFKVESNALGHHLASIPTRGLAFTKQLLNASATNTLASQLEMEREYQEKAAATRDSKEGIQAFLEKRKPEFKGH